MCTCLLSCSSHVQFCDPMDHSPPGSFVQGILRARILEWVTMPSSRDLSNPRVEPSSLASPALAGGFLTTSPSWEYFWNSLLCGVSFMGLLEAGVSFEPLSHGMLSQRLSVEQSVKGGNLPPTPERPEELETLLELWGRAAGQQKCCCLAWERLRYL